MSTRVEHVRTPEGAKRYHLPIGTVIVAHHGESILDAVKRMHAGLRSEGIDGASLGPKDAHSVNTMFRTEAHEHSGDRFTDAPKLTFTPDPKSTLESVNTQEHAQRKATRWYERVDDSTSPFSDGPAASDLDQLTASMWQEYQAPSQYGKINAILRDGKPIDGVTKPQLQSYVSNLWDHVGYKLPADMTVYRALKGKRSGMPQDVDWAKVLRPGSVFKDDGFVSTTAYPNFAQGWLHLNHGGGTDRVPQADDVVMEIRVPKGTKVVGGHVDFIETMLRPGSKFKVVSSERRMGTPEDPLAGGGKHADGLEHGAPFPPYPYTHVIVELMP